MTISKNMAVMLESFRETIIRYIEEPIPQTAHDYVIFGDFRSTIKTHLKTLAELADRLTPETAAEVYIEIMNLQRNTDFAVMKYYNEIQITASPEYEFSKVWSSCTHKMSTVRKMLEAYYQTLFVN